ncbi:MAG: hypothetical protein ONB17_02030 [candidate division KSB1 bacterium]|nr:hypothetical protein [candidate division KSB1 bacterium]MDZ7294213.1 hypothetical protein [candidate division KSB1 bacterium]
MRRECCYSRTLLDSTPRALRVYYDAQLTRRVQIGASEAAL